MIEHNKRIVRRRGAAASTIVLVLLLLVVTAVAAYLMGAKTNGDIWNRDQPSERALRRAGLVMVEPHGTWNPLRRPDAGETSGVDWHGLAVQQRTQANLIESPSLIARVIANPNSPIRMINWYKSYNNDMGKAKLWLEKHLRAEPIADSQLVRVYIDDDSISGRDAKTIIETIVNQHLEEQQSLNTTRMLNRATTLNNLRQKFETRKLELEDKRNRRITQLSVGGVGSPGRYNAVDVEFQVAVNKQAEFEAAAVAAETRVAQLQAEMGDAKEETAQLKEARASAQNAKAVAAAFGKRIETHKQILSDLAIATSDYLSISDELTRLSDQIKNIQTQLDAINAAGSSRQVEWAQRPEVDDAG